jgi:branched-chain amino acid transport system ATP-binding protein
MTDRARAGRAAETSHAGRADRRLWIGLIDEIAEQLAALANSISVILVEQHIELALRVAQYAYVMDRGSIALQGPSALIRTDANLLRYLSP